MAYTYSDLVAAYRSIGIEPGQVAYAVSELWRLREYQEAGDTALVAAHFNALMEILGPSGTLVVSTASTNICNTETVFDPATTPSYGVGILSEFVRQQPGSRRSFHPFVSYTAIGRLAEKITAEVSRHAYGPETPEARLIDLDARLVSIGMRPNFSCSTAHHVEQIAAVPFRYIKEFVHPVRRGAAVDREVFYMHVWYRDTGMVKDRYEKLFSALDPQLSICAAKVGAGKIYAYSMADFSRLALPLIAHNPYISCRQEPVSRPYRI